MIRVKKDQKRSSLDGISQFSEDLENEWVPMSRNQKSRKPINPTSKTKNPGKWIFMVYTSLFENYSKCRI